MNIYLVRHGDAVNTHGGGDRPLSDQGRWESTRMAEFLRQRGVRVDGIVHSGKARAAQTAEILCRGTGFGGQLAIWPGLNPNDPVAPIADRLRESNTEKMLVGHLPFMSKLSGYLVSGVDDPILELQNVAVVCLLHDDTGEWRIEWLVYPELLDFA